MANDDGNSGSDVNSMSWLYRLLRRAGLTEKSSALLTMLVLAAVAGFYVFKNTRPKEPAPGQPQGLVVTQSGTGNTQQTIGTLTQNGGSGCTQNVGIGNNNVLNCKSQLPTMSASQVKQVSALLVDAPKISGSVVVTYETTSDENVQLAHNLYQALLDAHIESRLEGHFKTFGGTMNYPSLSIMYVKHSNLDLANAIEAALLKAKVISTPLEPTERNLVYQGDDLTFVIRDP